MTDRGVRTKMSSKGQVVVPRDVRERHGWSDGTALVVEETPQGVLLRLPEAERTLDLEALVGCAGYAGPRRSLRDMERAIAAEARRRQP